jgi:hypothetical protein
MANGAIDVARIVGRMEGVPGVVRGLCAGLTDADARAKGAAGQWSILEIVCHLCDEEELDFGARLRSLVRDPAAPWPGTDPEAWAVRHRYVEQDLEERLEAFARLRAGTVAWLRSLPRDLDWTEAYLHPNQGPIPRGELLVAWPAHDALHVRQIAKRLYELAERDGAAGGWTVRYAGAWGA